MTDLQAAWAASTRTRPVAWYVGRPGFEERYDQWSMHAFDLSEKPVVGKRSREWTAVGPTELRCVQEMAYCLGELKEGRCLQDARPLTPPWRRSRLRADAKRGYGMHVKQSIVAVATAALLLLAIGATPVGALDVPEDCTIVGTAGPDTLIGTGGDDVICGLHGDDRLYGAAGDDILVGGHGNDILVGGHGNDSIYGWYGDNIIRGGGGHDEIWGGWGDDVIAGGPGNDDLLGERGHDRVFGGPGDDRIVGGLGRDVLKGGVGGDMIWGSEGADRISGGYGRDRLDGGPGPDIIAGGPARDALFARDESRDVLDGGRDRDTGEWDWRDKVRNVEERR